MKTIILILYLLLTAMTGMSMVVLPPAGGTNGLAEMERANRINVEWQNYYIRNGRIDRLERQVDRLETGFLIVAVLIGSTFSALIALATRDRISDRKSIEKTVFEQTTNGLRQKTD